MHKREFACSGNNPCRNVYALSQDGIYESSAVRQLPSVPINFSQPMKVSCFMSRDQCLRKDFYKFNPRKCQTPE